MRRVEKKSLGYLIIRFYANIFHRLSNRTITVNGVENIPKDKPIILASNHQNALLDALAIGFTNNTQPVFLARADIFKKKFIARVLNYLKLAPVYRMRDGKDSLDKNVEVFENSVRILQNNRALCLFPEGTHIGLKSMLPHKKAIPRIVFIAAEMTNFELDINIVPIGLTYSHYYNFRRSVVVNYGQPISSKSYYSLFRDEGETKASNALRDDLYKAIDQLVVNVPDKAYYDIYNEAFEMAKPFAAKKLRLKYKDKYLVDIEKYIVEKVSSLLNNNEALKTELDEKAKQYHILKEKLKIAESELLKPAIGFRDIVKSLVVLLLLLPFAALGAICNGWVYYLTRYPMRKIVKDKQFYSTFTFGLSIIVYPIWFILLFVIFYVIFKSGFIALGLIILSVPSGILAWELMKMMSSMITRIKIGLLKSKNNKHMAKLLELRIDLLSFYYQSINS